MQATLFAPLLSATSSSVVVWIMALCLRLGLGLGLDQDLGHPPALLLRQRPRLHDADLVAGLRRLLLVVALVLLLLGQVLAVLAVLHPALDLDHHRLRHLVGEDGPDPALRLPALRCRLLRILAHGYSFFPAGCEAAAAAPVVAVAVPEA